MSTAVQQALADLCSKGVLHGEDVADVLSVAPATVARWLRGEAVPDLPTRAAIGQIHFIVGRLTALFAADEVRHWLNDVQPALKGARPVDLIRGGRTAEVLAAIDALDMRPTP
ncbi:antitoxin Xre/MbcA/ParS toxin-binding domain-containing protein [Blastochloris viridis]|uniref:Uncharacterized protein n=1 Tax=Blastochloris viridis TaxID=1079 RepID=A0A0H5BIV3_BLAVI|nr:antitoxin Xre/MbcA/ParS toxin-binding domain-containing protein [Blastochloris viridis]ALK09045.1 hypothetical protein BVIR_1258 [Blastochloris viridis]BAS01095.1 hypothetical protein BV133_3501 [Blastochloris viridis]CUU41707.1 hypothetical protein BVIRIDIS_07020 [Blastochloris viridis]